MGRVYPNFVVSADDSGKPCQLSVLIAGRSRLEDPGATALATAIKEMGTLTTLRIPQSGITPAGMEASKNVINL